jgi:glyoxylase-like metal-dependent hydrolase (beta-lactamase superfamily II)
VTAPLILDTQMHGIRGSTAAFLVRGERTALVETGPRSSLPTLLKGLESVTDELDWIVVTHIHLDHAGAAGALAARFPSARVAVHERGARHLADPARLWASVQSIYGSQAQRLWGGIDPVAAERIHVVRDGDRIDLGGGRGLDVLETPGHARHHHAFMDDETGILFAGDALGMQLPGSETMRPATAPPEHDLRAALASMQRIRSARPSAVWLTHFGEATHEGRADGVDAVCDRAADTLQRWHDIVAAARRTGARGADGILAVAGPDLDALESSLPADVCARLDATNSRTLNVEGIERSIERIAGTDPQKEEIR